MDLKKQLLELENKIRDKENRDKQNVILLHAKAHMFHNKKMHAEALRLMQTYNISHTSFNELDI